MLKRRSSMVSMYSNANSGAMYPHSGIPLNTTEITAIMKRYEVSRKIDTKSLVSCFKRQHRKSPSPPSRKGITGKGITVSGTASSSDEDEDDTIIHPNHVVSPISSFHIALDHLAMNQGDNETEHLNKQKHVVTLIESMLTDLATHVKKLRRQVSPNSSISDKAANSTKLVIKKIERLTHVLVHRGVYFTRYFAQNPDNRAPHQPLQLIANRNHEYSQLPSKQFQQPDLFRALRIMHNDLLPSTSSSSPSQLSTTTNGNALQLRKACVLFDAIIECFTPNISSWKRFRNLRHT